MSFSTLNQGDREVLIQELTEGIFGQYYTLEKYLGGGGFGKVFVAKPKYFEDECFVAKFIKTLYYNPDEVEILKKVKGHDNIVQILGEMENSHYKQIFFPFDEKKSFQNYLIKNTHLHELHIRQLFCQMASAVSFIHCLNIAHLDIKPDNIILGADMELKLIDFGVAKDLSKEGQGPFRYALGTRQYLAPEMLQGRGNFLCYPKPADVWALGVTLFVSYFHTYPYEVLYDDMYMIDNGCPFAQVQRACSPEFEELLRNMLDFDCTTRITMDEILDQDWVKGVITASEYVPIQIVNDPFETKHKLFRPLSNNHGMSARDCYTPSQGSSTHASDCYSQVAGVNTNVKGVDNTIGCKQSDIDDILNDMDLEINQSFCERKRRTEKQSNGKGMSADPEAKLESQSTEIKHPGIAYDWDREEKTKQEGMYQKSKDICVTNYESKLTKSRPLAPMFGMNVTQRNASLYQIFGYDKMEMINHPERISNHDGIMSNHVGHTTNDTIMTNDQNGNMSNRDGKMINHDGDISNHDGHMSNYDGDISNHDRTMSNHDRTMSNHDGDMINHDGDMSNHDGIMSNNDGIISNYDRDISNHDGTLSNHDGTMSNHVGCMTNDTIITNDENGNMSNHDGNMSNHDGTMSNHDITMSNHDGNMSNHDRTMTNHDGIMSNHDGDMSNHVGCMTNDTIMTNDQNGNMSNHDGKMSNHDGHMSNYDGHMSNHDRTMSNHDGIVSNHDGTMSNHCGIMSNHDGTMSNHVGCMTNDTIMTNDENGNMSNHDGNMSNHNGTMKNHDGTMSNHNGIMSNHDGTMSNHDGIMSNHGGIMSNHDGTMSNHDGDMINHDGDMSNHDGTMSNHDGIMSNHGGIMSNHDGDMINHDGDMSNHDGIMSNYDRTVSKHDGTMSNHDGDMSNHVGCMTNDTIMTNVENGNMSNDDGIMSNHDGTMTNHDGIMSNHNGIMSNHDGTMRDHDENLSNYEGRMIDNTIRNDQTEIRTNHNVNIKNHEESLYIQEEGFTHQSANCTNQEESMFHCEGVVKSYVDSMVNKTIRNDHVGNRTSRERSIINNEEKRISIEKDNMDRGRDVGDNDDNFENEKRDSTKTVQRRCEDGEIATDNRNGSIYKDRGIIDNGKISNKNRKSIIDDAEGTIDDKSIDINDVKWSIDDVKWSIDDVNITIEKIKIDYVNQANIKEDMIIQNNNINEVEPIRSVLNQRSKKRCKRWWKRFKRFFFCC